MMHAVSAIDTLHIALHWASGGQKHVAEFWRNQSPQLEKAS